MNNFPSTKSVLWCMNPPPPKAILFYPGEFQADCPFTMLKLIEKTFETHVSNCSETPSPLLGCERPFNHTLSSALDFYLYHSISLLRRSYKVFLIIFNPYFSDFSQTYPSTPYYFSFMSSIFFNDLQSSIYASHRLLGKEPSSGT